MRGQITSQGWVPNWTMIQNLHWIYVVKHMFFCTWSQSNNVIFYYCITIIIIKQLLNVYRWNRDMYVVIVNIEYTLNTHNMSHDALLFGLQRPVMLTGGATKVAQHCTWLVRSATWTPSPSCCSTVPTQTSRTSCSARLCLPAYSPAAWTSATRCWLLGRMSTVSNTVAPHRYTKLSLKAWRIWRCCCCVTGPGLTFWRSIASHRCFLRRSLVRRLAWSWFWNMRVPQVKHIYI